MADLLALLAFFGLIAVIFLPAVMSIQAGIVSIGLLLLALYIRVARGQRARQVPQQSPDANQTFGGRNNPL